MWYPSCDHSAYLLTLLPNTSRTTKACLWMADFCCRTALSCCSRGWASMTLKLGVLSRMRRLSSRICNHERRRLGQRTTIQLCSSRLYTRSRWPPGHPCSDISSILCCSKGQHAQSVHVVCSICACVCVVSTDLARTASTYMLTTNGICEISRTTIVVDACCLLLSWLLRSSFSIATSFPGEHAYKFTHTPYYTYTHMCVCGCVFSLPPFLLAPHVARV
mmetsp:Transcript_26958/g.39664  ORF Transcript_26958/g.39664 Transcript_26958/m.39664 type:complete len:219 (+) Transcript_26958:624-1280(+)